MASKKVIIINKCVLLSLLPTYLAKNVWLKNKIKKMPLHKMNASF